MLRCFKFTFKINLEKICEIRRKICEKFRNNIMLSVRCGTHLKLRIIINFIFTALLCLKISKVFFIILWNPAHFNSAGLDCLPLEAKAAKNWGKLVLHSEWYRYRVSNVITILYNKSTGTNGGIRFFRRYNGIPGCF